MSCVPPRDGTRDIDSLRRESLNGVYCGDEVREFSLYKSTCPSVNKTVYQASSFQDS